MVNAMKNQNNRAHERDSSVKRETVSCAVVAFNEEKNLHPCLESAKWMDEIVVVDSFSTDATMDIARMFTDKIFQRPWRGFGDQKNYAMDQASTD